MHLHGPFQELTDEQPLCLGVWHELPTGLICKLYSSADWVSAYLDFRLICPQQKRIKEEGRNMHAAVGRYIVDLTCNGTLCLLTISHALDA